MKKQEKSIGIILWGFILIAIGVVLALNALEITSIDIFFDGWWTLLIIVPCGISLFTQKEKTGNIIGILVGVFLLLCCQDILSFKMVLKLLVPVVIILVGLKMVIGDLFNRKADNIMAKIKENGGEPRVGCAVFSSSDINFNGEVFDGAELSATFGSVSCDLRNAIIEKDCAIKVSAIFGGVEIYVPQNVNVKVNSNSFFGGISNKATSDKNNTVTLYIKGTCMFGGVDIQ